MNSAPRPKTNQYRIVRAKELMSSDPSDRLAPKGLCAVGAHRAPDRLEGKGHA
jgi:hypothetical protein